jgi:hypothetical protein
VRLVVAVIVFCRDGLRTPSYEGPSSKAAGDHARGAAAVGGDDEFAAGGISRCVADAADASFGEEFAVRCCSIV